MPKRTIYVREEDLHLWERAEQLAGAGNLSGLLATALKELVARKEAEIQSVDHGPATKRILYVWGSHSPDGRHASGTSFEADQIGSVRADDRIRAFQADPSIAHIELEERQVFDDGWITRGSVDEWVRDSQGWRRAAVPVTTSGDPYLVRTLDRGKLTVRNVGGGPAINVLFVVWQGDTCRMSDFFHCMAGEERAIEYSHAGRMWPPSSILTDQAVDGRREGMVCSGADGRLWRFLPLLPTSMSGPTTLEHSQADWISWYVTNVSYPKPGAPSHES
jgi:hypothetical protein